MFCRVWSSFAWFLALLIFGGFLGKTSLTSLPNRSDQFGQMCVLEEIFLEQVFLW
jgi:hypothetical protein